jgi:hypothetical protein
MRREMIGICCFLQSLTSLIDTDVYPTQQRRLVLWTLLFGRTPPRFSAVLCYFHSYPIVSSFSFFECRHSYYRLIANSHAGFVSVFAFASALYVCSHQKSISVPLREISSSTGAACINGRKWVSTSYAVYVRLCLVLWSEYAHSHDFVRLLLVACTIMLF